MKLSSIPSDAWALLAAIVGFAAWLSKKLLFRQPKPKPDYITRAEFHERLDRFEDRSAENHQEVLAAIQTLSEKTELRLDAHESALARLDERTTINN